MNRNNRTLSVFLVAGLVAALPALAQNQTQPQQQPQQQNEQPAQRRQAAPVPADQRSQTPRTDMNTRQDSMRAQGFASADKIRGATIENTNGDNLGSVSDLIIDRGSGRVTHVLLSAGGFLGIGSKTVVVPFDSFRWNAANKRFTLETTPEAVKAWPEYQKDSWTGSDTSLSRRLSSDIYRTPGNYYPSDRATDSTKIAGTVKQVDRQPIPGTNNEELVVTVQTNDNRQEQVVLGPTWYMAGNSIAVYRDSPISVDVTRLDRDGRQVMVARSADVSSRNIPLYNESGTPRWGAGSDSSSMQTYPLILNSELDGKHISARGERCGKIDDLIVDTGSGRIAFLAIDPDQNVLGIADKKRLVPWTVAMLITSDGVMIDSTKAMIVNAPVVPSDLATLSTDAQFRNIYQGYGTSEPYYNRPDWNNSGSDSRTRDRDLQNPASTNPNNSSTPSNPTSPTNPNGTPRSNDPAPK